MPSQTEMSKQAFEEKLKDKPKSLVFSRLADSYRKSGDVQQAITICSEGLKLRPDYVTGQIILGRCYLEQENFNDAIKEFSKVCKQDRRNHIAIKMLADIFSKQGMEEKAGDLYNLLLKMDPYNPSVVHLANIFKGSNKENLFEILGIEEDVKVEKAEEDQEELQEALDEIGSEDIDQEVETPDATVEEAGVSKPSEEELKEPELTTEEEAVVSELAGEDIEASEITTEEDAAVAESVEEDLKSPEITSDDEVAVAESLEEELKDIGISTEEEAVTAETEVTPEDIAAPEVEEEAAATLEAITEDLEIPELEAEAEVQADAALEKEPSLDEILSPEGDILPEASLTEGIKVEEKPSEEEAEDIVAESEEITELAEEEIEIEEIKEEAERDKAKPDEGINIEELADQEAEKEVESTAAPDRLERQAEKVDDELPGGDDISARMGSMFGEDVEELGVDISETAAPEGEIPLEETGTTITARGSEDTTPSPEVSELSSRIEDIFGDEGEAVEPTVAAAEAITEEIIFPEDIDRFTAEEKAQTTTEEVLSDIDLASAPTATIDKDILDKIRESDTALTEKAEEEISEIEDVEPELLGISEEVAASIEDISDEKEVESTPTEVIDIEEIKTELVEEPSDIEEAPDLFDEEKFDELVIDQEDKEDITDSMVTEATAIFDKETISKLATAEVDELEEALDTPVKDGAGDTSSVSGEDVFSRLDEMFPADTIQQPVKVTSGEIKKIAGEPVLEETAASTDQKKELAGKQTESIPMDTVDSEEQLLGEDIESRIDEMFVEDALLEEISIDSIPDEEIGESVISGDYYTEGGEAAPLEDKEVIKEESEGIPAGSDTVALNISPAEEMAVVEDETVLSEMSIDSIPGEEIEKDESTGEFYTETGEAAPLEDIELTTDEVMDIPVTSDAEPTDFISVEEITVADDETIDSDMSIASTPDEDIDEGEATGDFSFEEIDDIPATGDAESIDLEPEKEIAPIDDDTSASDIAIDSIPDEDIEEGEATLEFYTESGEVALDESGVVTEKETEASGPDEPAQDLPLTGEDVIASMDKIFPEDQLTVDSSVDTIPDEEVGEETTVGDGFYNVSGEEALTAEVDESVLSTLEEEGIESIPEDEETFFFESDSSEEVAYDQQIIHTDKNLPQKTESIPDHVLTPTLADIYFQQEQPQLAVQIYRRLLERDPENEKIAERIIEIEQVIKEKEALIEKTAAEKEKAAKKVKKKKSRTRKKKIKDDKRPLKGVKIKKNFKERIKKARK